MDSNIHILQSGRVGLKRETKLPMQELGLKVQGAYARGGAWHNSGILWYVITITHDAMYSIRFIDYVDVFC